MICDGMPGPGGFVFCIGNDLRNELVQRNIFHVRVKLTTLQTCEDQDASDHLVQIADLGFHAIVRVGLD